MKRYFILAFGILNYSLFAQSNLKIGEWRSHHAFRSAPAVTQSPQKVYYSAGQDVLLIDKQDGGIDFLSTVGGLSETGIIDLNYNSSQDVVILVYESSNIDLIFEDQIINISDIRDNINIQGSRRINDVYVFDSEYIYFSTDFGIVEFNLATLNFGFTSFTEFPVFEVIKRNGVFYASTEDGVYSIDEQGGGVVADFNAWNFLGAEFNLPTIYSSEAITIFDGRIYLDVDGRLFKEMEDGKFEVFFERSDSEVGYLSPSDNHLIVGMECGSCDGEVYFLDSEGNELRANNSCVDRPRYAIEDESGNVWFADGFDGLRMATGPEGFCDAQKFNTPFSNSVFDIHAVGSSLHYTTGAVSSSYNFQFKRDGFSTLNSEGIWSNVHNANNDFLRNNDVYDYLNIITHPDDPNRLFVGTYSRGLIEILNQDSFFLWNQDNSTLRGTTGTETEDRVTGLAFDANKQLWVTNFLADNALSVYNPSTREWKSFNVGGIISVLDLDVDDDFNKWMIDRALNVGIVVYHEGDPDDPNDDRVREISPGNSELTSAVVTAIAVDLEGSVWVGTAQGPIIFDCPNPFSPDCRGLRKKVDLGGFIAFLLETEMINDIAIDGGNRKWIATNNGVFLLSPSGDEQLAHLTVENSPLSSNVITAIDVNLDNGEVYIGTTEGLMSFRTDATLGGVVHETEIRVFPNPVYPEYEGPIAIDGLIQDAVVKITDVEGNLVFEVQANGGQAIWNGRDLSGREVSSGVYLVFSSSNDSFTNPDTAIAKILFVR